MRAFFVTFIMAILLTTSPARAAETRNLGDWYASCDEYDNCVATSARLVYGNLPDQILSIARQAYADNWEVSLVIFSETTDAPNRIVFSIDGKSIQFEQGNEFAAYDKLNQYYILGQKAQTAFDSILAGDEAIISYSDQSGEQQVAISLKGISASLLWIDEQQDSVGSKRITGEEPKTGTLVTSREPDPLPDEMLDAHNASPECEPLDELVHGNDIVSFRLDAENSLYLIPCWAGAYNFGFVAWLKDNYEIKRLHFASYYEEQTGWTGTMFLVNPYFSEKYNILVDFYKGRGLGDCGTSGLWLWNKYSFRMLEYSAQPECGEYNEDEEIGVGSFPIIYRAPDYMSPDE